ASGSPRDAYGVPLGDDNPLGNPGFGDFRILRSSEPQRYYQNGLLSGYSHWPHLSFPATAENGWRLCFDIRNVAPFDLDDSDPDNPTADPSAGFTLDFTAAEAFANGATGYLAIEEPVALQTPYEQWFPGVVPNTSAVGNVNAFLDARERWFSAPEDHFQEVMTPDRAFPNFIRLQSLNADMRDVVERTYADSDGDGFTDAFWFLLPGTSEDGIRQVAAVSVVDNASMVDVNVATRFDPQSTAGTTPADVALTSRLFTSQLQQINESNQFDQSDTWVGLFSDPQNTWPAGDWGFQMGGPDTEYEGQTWDSGDSTFPLRTAYDGLGFGDDPTRSHTWLRQVGVVNPDKGASGFNALEDPYRSALSAQPGGYYAWLGDFDRRRYFRGRQSGGGPMIDRNDQFAGHVPRSQGNNNFGATLPETQWATVEHVPRGFGNSDELELRMFASSNYSPSLSNLERTVNRPWARNYNLFRSSMTRDENYFAGDKLTAMQLLRDTRHRATTYSATRNDLRPIWLRTTPVYDDFQDYFWGWASWMPVPSEPNQEQGGWDWYDDVSKEARRVGYEHDQRKLDLRAPLDAPISELESYLYFTSSENGRLLRPGGVGSSTPSWNFMYNSGTPVTNTPQELVGRYWNSQDSPYGRVLALDRALRFRTELQRTLDRTMAGFVRDASGTPYCQSWLGNSFDTLAQNQAAYLKTLLLDASWAANIDTFRDNQPRGVATWTYADVPTGQIFPNVEAVYLDQPIYPDWAPRVSLDVDSDLPDELDNLTFVGKEAQPYIMEAFFALVYPKSKMTDATQNRLRNENRFGNTNLPDFDIPDDEDGEWEYLIPFFNPSDPEVGGTAVFNGSGFRWVDKESKPAIVFAIQLANPYDKPVGLHDIRIRIGDSQKLLNLSRLPCPHPSAVNPGDRPNPYFRSSELYLGPTKADAPRTAIVFGIIPPDGYIGDTTGQEFEDAFDQSYEEFHESWVDFLDLQPGNLFGYDKGLAMSELQTLVFDASPTTYHRQTPDSSPVPFDQLQLGNILDKDPEKWFSTGSAPLERSVELLRLMQNPLTFDASAPDGNMDQNNLRAMVIDRLDNEQTGSKSKFSDQMVNLHEPNNRPQMDQAYTYKALTEQPWNGIHIDEEADFLVTWVRAGRAWGWDVNRNGVYDMNEVSPRYIFPELPKDDWTLTRIFGVETSARPTVGLPSSIGGQDDGDRPILQGIPGQSTKPGVSSAPPVEMQATTYKIGDEPDGGDGADPWLTRSYYLPLATRDSYDPGGQGGGTLYPLDFDIVKAKPVRFSTATPIADTNGTIDYDAGFPVYANGALRTTTDLEGWPGRPAANYRWIMMDKGQGTMTEFGSDFDVDELGRNGDYPESGASTYSRFWLEKDQWAYPLQMLQKDADFEQVGEVANTFLWGHAIRYRPGFAGPEIVGGIPVVQTVATFGEIMNGIDPQEDLFPVRRSELASAGRLPWFNAGWQPAPISRPNDLPVLQDTYPIELVHTNRWFADPGFLSGQASALGGGTPPDDGSVRKKPFRPFTQSLEVKSLTQPWAPSLPAGAGLFDALVCDGPGANTMVDVTGGTSAGMGGSVGVPDKIASTLERLANQDARFDLAGGFTGRPTRGLININTASPEVLRTLPQMSRLAYNTSSAWSGTWESNSPAWVGYARANPTLGDVDAGGVPRANHAASSNPQWIRVPEMIERYRDGTSFSIRSEQMNQVLGGNGIGADEIRLTHYADRGTVNYDNLSQPFGDWLGTDPYLPLGSGYSPDQPARQGIYPGHFPGMRRGSGFASLGELTLMGREGYEEVTSPVRKDTQIWASRAGSIRAGGKDPYAGQLDMAAPGNEWIYGSATSPFNAADSGNFQLLGLGWRPYVNADGWAVGPTGQADARLATDRQHTRFQSVEIPDNVGMDAEESNMLFAGISNLVTTRSDTFTVYLKVRSFKQNPVTGVWDATDPEFLVDDSRYIMVVDRSKCESPSDEPEIRFLNQVPN
ncbi:MAG: hypothetical protein MK085_05075, partial [Phycisphaerales bacterium]|nr:hypothetical protein [Phycisphaerales bacterium]